VNEQVARAAKALRDEKSGYVDRRDAAQALGEIASDALGVLHQFREEEDVDVRSTIDKALGAASAALAGITPAPGEGPTLEDLARSCEKEGERRVEPSGDGFAIHVQGADGRKQTVYARPHKRKDGVALIKVYTHCGPYREDALAWALRANTNIAQGALALEKGEDGEEFVLVNSFITGEVTPREFKGAVKEIAFYGDWIEKKLTGLDEF
jgi:hypothetical protein